MASPWDDDQRFRAANRRGFTMTPTSLAVVMGLTIIATVAVIESVEDHRASMSTDESQTQSPMIERKAEAFASPSQAPNVHYRNCAEARAAGAAPIYRGEPGYEERMDGDHDGIACEPYYGR